MENKDVVENKEVLYDESEVEELKKAIKVLESEKEDLLQTKLPSNVDKYAIDYVKTIDEDKISYLTTKELFDNYLTYRRGFTEYGEERLTLRMFNSVVRRYFPKAKVNHSNRQGNNIYFWVFEDE